MTRRFASGVSVSANASANLELVPKQQLDSAISGLSATYQPLDSDLTSIAGLSPSNDDVIQRKAGVWANRSIAQLLTDLGLGSIYQPLDSDLTAIAALTATTDTFLQAKSSAWTTRTPTQVAADLVTPLSSSLQPIDSDLTAIAALTPSNDDVLQRKAGAWTNRTIAQLLTDLAAAGTTFQPLDTDLTAIAGLTATTDNFIQSKSSAWASRTPAQVAADLPVIANAFVAAKGDLIGASANDTPALVTVGANNTVLVADSGATPGVAWKANPVPVVFALTDGANVAVNAANGEVQTLIAAGNRIIDVPTNAVHGMKLIIRIEASGGARTITLTTGSAGSFRFGSTVTALTAVASGLIDYIACIYNSGGTGRWDVVGYMKGF